MEMDLLTFDRIIAGDKPGPNKPKHKASLL